MMSENGINRWIGRNRQTDIKMGDVGMLSIDILLAMATKDMLIKQCKIPADIMK